MNDKRITSIVTHNISHALSSGEDVAAQKVHIYRHGLVKQQIFNGMSKLPIREYKYKVNRKEIERFFRFIEHEIRVESWEDDYSILVYDGWSWEFSIRYSDNNIKKVIGTVESPPQGKRLEEHINNLVVFNEEPWLF